jgi:esterase/lipase superfamily enzyme
MGAWLVMEALHQLKLQGRDDVLSRLRVFLASPDIDANVFQSQLAAIGRMRQPITLFVSKDDVALRVSGLLAGDRRRIGVLDVEDPVVMEVVRQKGVVIIDVSAIPTRDGLGHGRYAALASVLPRLDRDSQGGPPSLSQAGAFIFDAAAATISSPFRLGSKIVSP